MYLGKLVETATSEELYARPLHPYTQVLLSNALPSHPDDMREEVVLLGEVPSALIRRAGVAFIPAAPRPCPSARRSRPRCGRRPPDTSVACHLYGP